MLGQKSLELRSEFLATGQILVTGQQRAVLLGGLDETYQSLLAQRLAEDGLEVDDMSSQLRAHIHRGIELLSTRVRTLSDIEELTSYSNAKGDASAS